MPCVLGLLPPQLSCTNVVTLQDGGRILVDTLLTCGLAERTTALVTCGVAAPIAIGIIVWGCVQFQVITILVGVLARIHTNLAQQSSAGFTAEAISICCLYVCMAISCT